MKAYHLLSSVPLLERKFARKILFVSFAGIHIPLFFIIGYLLASEYTTEAALVVGGGTLAFTLLATGITLYILNIILRPVEIVKRALHNYIQYGKIPSLPTYYKDEIGVLMYDVQYSIESLERYYEEKENILHLLSHDLQGPINSALSALELIREGVITEDILRALEGNLMNYRENLRESINYIKQQKNMMEEGHKMVKTNISAFIQDAVEAVHCEANAKGIRLHSDAKTSKAAYLPVAALNRVVQNVVGNAVKYSPAHSTVYICADIVQGSLEISVRDSGEGISPERLSSVFAYNKRLKDKYQPGKPSNGIGLHLCKKLMRSLGGDIRVENNTSGQGCTFTIDYLIEGQVMPELRTLPIQEDENVG